MELMDYERIHLERLRRANAGCTLFLKRNGRFPLRNPEKVALYGAGARHTLKGGTGSGEVNGHFFTTIEQGLQDAGFVITSNDWLDGYDDVREQTKKEFRKQMKREARAHHQQTVVYAMGKIVPEPEYDLPLNGKGDTAVYVLSRISGEGSDREEAPGNILLTQTEQRDILALERKYPKFMLVLNVGGPVDLTPVKDVGNILLLGQLGTETGAVLADILLGKSYPSGKLTTTWAAWGDYPMLGEFGCKDDTRYKEGIYVGYRYFDSAGKSPMFSFGYGMGYTDFSVKSGTVSVSGSRVAVSAEVKNTGNYPGREVIQVYLSAPSGDLDRPYQELAGLAKTEELRPGQETEVRIEFSMCDMTCYDAGCACYLLEAGDYLVRVGNSSADTVVAAVLRLPETVMVRAVKNVCGKTDFTDWKPDRKSFSEISDKTVMLELNPADFSMQMTDYNRCDPIDDFVKNLDDETLAAFNVGGFDSKSGIATIIGSAAMSVAGAAGETSGSLKDRGFQTLVMADGPAGLRLIREFYKDEKGVHGIGSSIPDSFTQYLPGIARWFLSRRPKLKKGTVIQYQNATAIPIGTAVAQSWDLDYAELCGDIIGAEMERFGVHLWLAPALNIHRDIRCGRNYEYYSEDPLISGKMAAAMTKGVQKHPGCGVTIKHYCANNQELNKTNNNSMVSERAMREIYLKGFGICVREGHPIAAMTSYNLLNGRHTSEHRGLLEDVLRCEFGFGGIVMTDWITAGDMFNKGAKYPAPDAGAVAAAGGDLFMPGSQRDLDQVRAALQAGTLSREQIQKNVTRIYRLGMRLNSK